MSDYFYMLINYINTYILKCLKIPKKDSQTATVIRYVNMAKRICEFSKLKHFYLHSWKGTSIYHHHITFYGNL